jgi:lipopolysaccharide export system permease protein
MLKMTMIDRYIGRTVLTSIAVTLAVLIGISSLFRFIDQLMYIGRGDFTFLTAGLFTLYLVPQDLEAFFPMAAMIGGLVGLGSMANNSELVVMQAVGMSKANVISAVLKSSTILIFMMMIFSEWGVPYAIHSAKELRTQAISEGKLYSAEQGLWAKDSDAFINIKEVTEEGELLNITIFDFSEDLKLTQQINAASGEFSDGNWLLNNVTIKRWQQNTVSSSSVDLLPWPTNLSPEKLGVVSIKPERMAMSDLVEYLQYLNKNEQSANRYELALWRKIFQPINVAVMLLLALSFIFGPLRSVTMGARVILGIITGFSFFLFDRIFGSMSLIYEVPTVIGAFTPTLLFSLIAMHLLTKKQK